MNCLSNFKQLNIFEQFNELNHLKKKQPTGFLDLLKNNFDINSFISKSFTDNYYANLGKDRDHSLSAVLSALLLMHIFKIPTTKLLVLFLIFSDELREFCGFFDSVPDESFFSRFQTQFENDIEELFSSTSFHTIDICVNFNEELPKNDPNKDKIYNLIYDTSGLKPRVKENNPKFLVAEINKQKVYAKTQNLKNYNPYAAAYKNMPKHAECNSNIKLDFLNGHFGYFYKFGLITNGWGIPLGINFFDDDFYNKNHQEFDSPEEQKYFYDNASLKPVLQTFLSSLADNSTFKFKNFLGDSEFDSYENFGFLKSCGFEKVFIPLNPRNTKNTDSILKVDEEGTPLCPLDKTPFLPDGSCKGKNRSFRLKYVCPKSIRIKSNWVCECQTPCRETKSTVTTYKYPDKDYRLYPGIQRCSQEWYETYKTRACIERELSCIKSNPCVDKPLTINTSTMRADLYLSAIAKQINVLLAYALKNPKYIRTINPILKIAA